MEYTENQTQASPSRRQFLKGSAVTGVAALVAAGAPRLAFAKQVPQKLENDLDIVNFALTLEHIEAEFYKAAVDSGNLSGDNLTVLTDIRDNEVAHVDALTAALEAADYEGIATADVVNTDAFDVSSEDAILELAATFEPVGVGAYTAAAPLIKDKGILAVAGSIEQIEARHAAAVRLLRGENPSVDTENALGETLAPDKVLEAVTPFLNS